MTFINRQQFEDLFLPHVAAGNSTLVLKSPHLSYMVRQSGFVCDKLPSDNYDSIIMDLDEDCPGRGSDKIPSYVNTIVDNFDYLNDDGILLVKAPLKTIRILQREVKAGFVYSNLNIKKLYIDSTNQFSLFEITKGEYIKTELSYDDGYTDTINFFTSLIPSRHDDNLFDFLNNFLNDKTDGEYEDLIIINGQHIKYGDNIKIKSKIINSDKYGLVMNINAKKVKFQKLENSNLTSSAVIATFDDKDIRDKYMTCLDRKAIYDLQLDLSYGGTVPTKLFTMFFKPCIFTYA